MHEVELNNVDPLYAQCLKVYCYDIESFRRQSKQIKNKKNFMFNFILSL